MPRPLPKKYQVIVDTSVWISFFNGCLSPENRVKLVTLLEGEEAAITDIIKHELLVGATSHSEYIKLSDYLSSIEELSISSTQRGELSRFGYELKKQGLLGKYTDLSIAFLAKEFSYPIWSFDHYFSRLAKKSFIQELP